MAKKKKRHPKTDALEIFLHARCFHNGALVLSQTAETSSHPSLYLFPMLVLEAFALEVHLKCLHRIRRRHVEGHKIRNLFDRLSKADRRHITQYLDGFLKRHRDYERMVRDGYRFDVDSIIARANDMFTNIRYWYEHKHIDVDDSGKDGNAGISPLCGAIWKRIVDLRPDWENTLWKSKLQFQADTPPRST